MFLKAKLRLSASATKGFEQKRLFEEPAKKRELGFDLTIHPKLLLFVFGSQDASVFNLKVLIGGGVQIIEEGSKAKSASQKFLYSLADFKADLSECIGEIGVFSKVNLFLVFQMFHNI